MKLYAARHGEATWNVEGRILGSQPGELTENGKTQALALAKNIQTLGLTKAYASDLQRVRMTVAAVQTALPALPIDFVADLRERHDGKLEGRLMSEVDWQGFWQLPPDESKYGAESVNHFTARVARFLVALEHEADTAVIGLFTHSGVLNRMEYLLHQSEPVFVDFPHAEAVEFDFAALLAGGKRFLAAHN